MNEPRARRWYREPMMWLALGLPLATLPAGIATWAIAAGAPLDAADDGVRRVAQVQTRDFAADRQAQSWGLHASLSLEGDEARVRLAGHDFACAPLRLSLLHPADAALDRNAMLACEHGAWHGTLAVPPAVAWRLVLEAEDGRWRLLGRLAPHTRAADLVPAWR